ncbi:unnamed protein product [Chondrus crispus]|uniref:Hint domain-containing protein n=1 Tax=Chondrus crispus TaxID=2769 RepID=R7QPN9_CHOCR|nr:unnamed protein product [Chondrus crispus]CDF39748.1 unnamed protein product [Chondrus crispus]|eukprot:XP_005710042.1 unnamed protein product [Chondrus crispus]
MTTTTPTPLLLLLSLLVLLPPAVCKTTRSDLIGVYVLHPSADQLADPALCPANMTAGTFQFAVSASPRRIPQPERLNIEIPHAVTTLAGRACDSAGAIDALESGHPFAADVEGILTTWARPAWASERFMGEVAKQSWNIGYDFLPRSCRDVSLPALVGYLWFEPGWDIVVGDSFQMMGGTKYLLLNFIGRPNLGCVYIATETGGPDNPGPVSDPSLGDEGDADDTDDDDNGDGDGDDGDDGDDDDGDDDDGADDDGADGGDDDSADDDGADDGSEGEEGEDGDADANGEDAPQNGDENDSAPVEGGAPEEPEDDGPEDGNNPDSAFNPSNQAPTGEEDDDGPACFPADATVQLKDGSHVAMRDLRAGHVVRVSGGHSHVYFFSHRQEEERHMFVRIRTEGGHSVRLSMGHYVKVGRTLVAAAAVQVGHVVEASGQPVRVVEVGIEASTGMFAPHTMTGDVVVDGVLVSTYTTAVHPLLAHVLLAPVRGLYRIGKVQWVDGVLDRGGGWVRSVLPRGGMISRPLFSWAW